VHDGSRDGFGRPTRDGALRGSEDMSLKRGRKADLERRCGSPSGEPGHPRQPSLLWRAPSTRDANSLAEREANGTKIHAEIAASSREPRMRQRKLCDLA
jgi:hypothetical protein